MVKNRAIQGLESQGDKKMAAPGENLRINGERLWDSLMEMAKIGPGIAGGNNR